MKEIRFITSCYGDNYLGFLLVTIFSIVKSNPGAHLSVIWEEIDKSRITSLKKAFPNVEFVKTDFGLSDNFFKRISSKTLLWNFAIEKYKCQNICLLDSDMLVRKDIGHFFDDNFDIAFTYKNEKFPLNTGIMLVKNSEKTVKFFAKWKESTMKILEDKEDFKKANSKKYPYGGADQMSFYKLIDYRRGVVGHTANIDDKKINLKGFPCELLNETRSVEVTEKTHVIHYKGGWRRILLEGGGFTKNRPKKTSFQMYKLFLKTYLDAIKLLKSVDDSSNTSDFNIKVHPYLDVTSWNEDKKKYFFFAIKQNCLFYFKKIRKLFFWKK